MAFGEKFDLSFVDLIRNNTWDIEIHEDGYVGAVSAMVGTGEPLTISWLETFLFDPIGASICSVDIQSETNFQYKEFLSAVPNQYLVKIKKNGSFYWQGTNITENNQEPYDDIPYNTSLKFTDGLGQLKFTEFEDGGLIDGTTEIIDIITFCLNKLPYQLNVREMINVIEESITSPGVTDVFLNTTFLNQQVFRNLNSSTQSFEGWNCLAVLREVLHAIGATIYQSDNKWRIVRIEEYEAASVKYVEYLAGTSTVDSDGTENVRLTIDNDAEAGISWINRNADLTVTDAFDEIEYIYAFGKPDANADELIVDSDFSIGISQLFHADQFLMWEFGSGLAQGLRPFKFNVPAEDFYYNVPTTGMYFDTPSMQINPVFDANKYLKPLHFQGSLHTKTNLVTSTNDNSVITWNGFLEMNLGAYSIEGNPGVFVDQVSQLNLPYEITFFVSVQIGTFYLQEDSDGVLSWGNDSSSVVSIRKIFDLKKPLYSWRGGILPDTPQTKDLTRVFMYGPVAIELPDWPENAINDLDVKFFQPATPIIFPDLNNPSSAIQAITLQVTPLSMKYQPNNGQVLTQILASSFNTNVKDRKKTVKVLFGDGPHVIIKNSFLVEEGVTHKSTESWVKIGATLESFDVTSVSNDGAGKASYLSTTDTHTYVVGQWIQGAGFSEDNYNVLQQVTQVLGNDSFITNAVFSVTDTGTLNERNTAAELFILKPYGKYFSEYRDDLRGDLTGNFAFHNSFLGDNGNNYFQRGAAYRIKSNEVTVQLVELDENVSVTTTTNQYGGTKPKVGATGDNSETTPPNEDAESATGNTGNKTQTTTQNMNVQEKSSQVIKINDTKTNDDDLVDYPSG